VLRYLARRLIAMVPLVLGTTLLVFALGRLAPGDPIQILFGDRGDALSIARARAELGLDRPLVEQYVRFVGRLARLDLGVSYAYPGKPVGELLAGAVSTSLMLGLLAVAVALAIGLPLGIGAAVRPGGVIDRLARLTTLIGIAVPFFVLAAGLVLLFSLRLGWLPVSGWGEPRHLVLPVVVLMARPMAYIMRVTRLAMSQVLVEDFVRTARAKGLGPGAIVLRHALRNAAITIATTAGLSLSLAFTGAFVTETIFGVPGMGRATVTAILQRDYPTIQAVVMLYTFLFLALNLVTDCLYAVLDPRVRYT
jgi:ABC-type dipeptide/oligopeptide/nickel transport system permease component